MNKIVKMVHNFEFISELNVERVCIYGLIIMTIKMRRKSSSDLLETPCFYPLLDIHNYSNEQLNSKNLRSDEH
jgi:hypothetical protein